MVYSFWWCHLCHLNRINNEEMMRRRRRPLHCEQQALPSAPLFCDAPELWPPHAFSAALPWPESDCHVRSFLTVQDSFTFFSNLAENLRNQEPERRKEKKERNW